MKKFMALSAAMLLLAALTGAEPRNTETPAVMILANPRSSLVFYDTEPVRFEISASFPGSYRYRVADWTGKTIRQGETAAGHFELSGLPRGYYTLTLENERYHIVEPVSFAVVKDSSGQQQDTGRFFAVDTAQSWLSKPKSWNERFPGEQFETVSELTRRAGYTIIRDRFGWKHVEPEPGVFDPGLYGRNAKMLAERGISICTLLDMTPEWAAAPRGNFPGDLAALYRTARQLAEHFKGEIFAWEFFNEADSGGKGAAWSLAAGAKAFSLGLKSVDPQLKVLNSSFHVSPLQHFAHTAMKSGMADYFDIFNYHVYYHIAQYPWLIERLQAEMAKYGIESMPIWITENGTNIEGVAAVPSYRPGTLIHSPEQEMLVAEFAAKSQITMQSLGVEKDFFFVMSPFWEQEGKKDWGLLRMDLTVKPAYVALANLNAQLGEARLLGALNPAADVCGYLYELPDRSQTLVYWSKSDVDDNKFDGKERNFTLPIPNGVYSVSNLFGTPSTVRAENDTLLLQATRYPAYLTGISGLKAAIPFEPKEFNRSENADKDLSIVLLPVLSEDYELSPTGAFAELVAEPGRISLEVYNFGPEEKQGKLFLIGGKSVGLPEEIVVAPHSKITLALSVMPEHPQNGCQTDLIFSGQFNGKEVSPATVPLIQTTAMLADGIGREINWREVSNWRANASGKMEISYEEAENALRLRTIFRPGTDRWVYPEYLLHYPEENPTGAVGVTFEIKAAPEIRHGVSYTSLMAVLDTEQERGKAFWLRYPKVSAEWEKRVVVFGGFDPSDVRMLRIGMNPKCDDFTYYIRNVRIIYGN